ncbi:MAG: squalene/phytoene synthase family protein [Planctomycetes bacterium]|nr:squalene/phytoene synthase family protein [Planctomycetota bacterium]
MNLPLPSTAAGDRAWCEAMLPRVSRTFAACIQLLPRPLDHQVLIAYLLCRIADTVEDTADLPLAQKQRLLAHFRACLDEGGPDAAPLAAAFPEPRDDDERLTAHADRALREFRALPTAQRAAIRPWVSEMCEGMAAFAAKHADAKPGGLQALGDLADLDRYCYYVAGTVGHLLTELFRLHHHRVTSRHYAKLKALSTSFGLGLQLTNIIKDVADDRGRGWSFVPRQLCSLAGITPEELLEPGRRTQANQVMDQLIGKARRHLDDALGYCISLPRSQYRIRLFCLTPLYFAIRTLRLAAQDPRLLEPGHKVKISRAAVYRTIRVAFLIAPNNHLVRAYYRMLAGGKRGTPWPSRRWEGHRTTRDAT